jgi:hypothetical protein
MTLDSRDSTPELIAETPVPGLIVNEAKVSQTPVQQANLTPHSQGESDVPLAVGDMVRVTTDAASMKKAFENAADFCWDDCMNVMLGKNCEVKEVIKKSGQTFVALEVPHNAYGPDGKWLLAKCPFNQSSDGTRIWSYPAELVTRISSEDFRVGDMVILTKDAASMKRTFEAVSFCWDDCIYGMLGKEFEVKGVQVSFGKTCVALEVPIEVTIEVPTSSSADGSRTCLFPIELIKEKSVKNDWTYRASDPNMEKKEINRRTSGLFGFSNVEDIKEKVKMQRLDNANPPYSVYDMYWEVGIFQKIARHPYFENFTLGVIVANALWLSFDTDGNTADTINDAKPIYIAMDIAFFGYFVIELFIRFMAFKRKSACCRDGWFVFDSALVFLYAFDPFTIGLIVAIKGGGGLNLPTAVLRLFRLARLSRLVRMLRSLPELMIMIKGMLSATASVGYTLGLLMVITYVFGIAFCNIVPDGNEWEDGYDGSIEKIYFSSVPEAMHNLVIYAVFLDNLSNITLDCKAQSAICLILLWMYIALAALTVLNMLVGVLCEVISAVAVEEKECMMIDKVKEKFTAIALTLDENKDMLLSWDEFKVIATDQEAIRTLKAVNVDPECLIDVAEDFFNEDGKKVFVEFEEFMTMVLDLRAGQPATVKDILSTGKSFTAKFYKTKIHLDNIIAKVQEVEAKIDKLLEAKRGRGGLGSTMK